MGQSCRARCEGEVTQVADGKTMRKTKNKNSPLVEAGAVRVRWPEDKERNEPETFSWHVLQASDWNADAHLGWRFTKAELAKRSEAAEAAARKQKEQREAAESARGAAPWPRFVPGSV
jgi:hypothetical protein